MFQTNAHLAAFVALEKEQWLRYQEIWSIKSLQATHSITMLFVP